MASAGDSKDFILDVLRSMSGKQLLELSNTLQDRLREYLKTDEVSSIVVAESNFSEVFNQILGGFHTKIMEEDIDNEIPERIRSLHSKIIQSTPFQQIVVDYLEHRLKSGGNRKRRRRRSSSKKIKRRYSKRRNSKKSRK